METLDPGSLKGQLRANRQRILADKSLTLKLPGWDSLYARYRRLPWERVQKLSGLGQGDATQDIGAAIDVLTAACQEVIFRGDDGDQPLGMVFEQRLAELIDEPEASSPPEVVMAVFPDEVSLMVHAGEYMEWAMRLDREASAELGNGSGRTSA